MVNRVNIEFFKQKILFVHTPSVACLCVCAHHFIAFFTSSFCSHSGFQVGCRCVVHFLSCSHSCSARVLW